ncbi:MAG TPA: molybdopterin cofactor-binding domain-containing protein [Terriglobales bacterium]|nr:molybdopterin cofactor-binding domain-containing protein [Terriglobales bacterium]
MSTSFSRRDFLKTSGALIVSFSAASLLEPLALAQGPFGTHLSHIDPGKLDSWIAVAADGMVTAYTGKCDFGQGMFTVQTQLIAEELRVPLHVVRLIQCDTSITPDEGTTSGSQSTPVNFNAGGLAQAAATAREALLNLASRRLRVPVDKLSIKDGVVTAGAGKQVSYGELVGGKRFNLSLNPNVKRIPPQQWTVLGKAIPSFDIAALATGEFEFVHNVHLPGMVHGRVVRPPTVGSTVANVDEDSVRGMPGLIKVVVRKNFVGVVAEKQWQAQQAARKLKVTWNPGGVLPAQQSFYEYIRKQPSRDVFIVDSQDVQRKLADASTVLRSTYFHPYQMHGSIGASCAVADVRGDKATLWSSTQSVYPTRSGVAMLLGLPVDNVRVIFTRGAGCYGLNAADTVSYDAALLSHAVQRPVRVQLSRKDEMAWGENYGQACVIEERAALDAHGSVAAWDCESWSVSFGGRPGYDHPGNVITGMLAGYQPQIVVPARSSEPAGEFRNGHNLAPSYVTGCVSGKCGGAGKIRSERILARNVTSPFFTGPLRSPLRLQNTFAHECFMDELCAHAKADPLAYRLQHLADERIIGVLKAAAQAAKWEPRRFPQASREQTSPAAGRGIACVAYEGDNGYAALIAEVEVDQSTGQVRARRFVAAADCGPISNPAGVRNQIEGGILQGLSRALGEEVTWDEHQITSTSWATYHSLPLGFEVPAVESVLVNNPGWKATGAGELTITVVAAAVGNAIFDATGARLREVPFTPARVKAALAARNPQS